jgi:hypothetical protein
LTARANLAETAESVAAAAGVDASLIVSTANDVVDQLGARA